MTESFSVQKNKSANHKIKLLMKKLFCVCGNNNSTTFFSNINNGETNEQTTLSHCGWNNGLKQRQGTGIISLVAFPKHFWSSACYKAIFPSQKVENLQINEN